jgi:hypothetical protein
MDNTSRIVITTLRARNLPQSCISLSDHASMQMAKATSSPVRTMRLCPPSLVSAHTSRGHVICLLSHSLLSLSRIFIDTCPLVCFVLCILAGVVPPASDGTWSYTSTCDDIFCTSNCQVTKAVKLGTCSTDGSMSYGRDVNACSADGAVSVLLYYNANIAGGSTCTGSPIGAYVQANSRSTSATVEE